VKGRKGERVKRRKGERVKRRWREGEKRRKGEGLQVVFQKQVVQFGVWIDVPLKVVSL